MTVRDWKELLKNYPDDMSVCIHTFRGVPEKDPLAPPADVEVKDVSISEHLFLGKKRKFQVLEILID